MNVLAGEEQLKYFDDSKHSSHADAGDQNSLSVNQSFSSIFRASADGCDTAIECENDIEPRSNNKSNNFNSEDATLLLVQEKEQFLNERSLEKNKESDFKNVSSLESRHDSDHHSPFVEEEKSAKNENINEQQDQNYTCKHSIGE